jgi:hypothetical protein
MCLRAIIKIAHKTLSKGKPMLAFPAQNRSQHGINMVDLMMWLVIAAMLLAAAIQGIGYYQKAAYLYQVKSDVMGGAQKVLGVSTIEHSGKVSRSVVDEGLVITNKTQDVVLESGETVTGKPLIRGTHPGLPGREVIYLFDSYGKYVPGVNVVNTGEIDIAIDDDGTGGGTPTTPLPDTDGDGIPDATDPDIDNNGTPNTVWESFNVVKDKQAAGDEVTYVNADGSKTTWNYKDTATYSHPHDPIAPNLLTSPYADILSIQKNPTDPKQISVTIGTNGQMSTATGAVGGHFGVYVHGDISCKNDSTGAVVVRYGRNAALLDALYIGATGNPGYNSANAYFGCAWGELPVAFTMYPDRYEDWLKPDGSPGYSYFFTKDQIVQWVPAGG